MKDTIWMATYCTLFQNLQLIQDYNSKHELRNETEHVRIGRKGGAKIEVGYKVACNCVATVIGLKQRK